jgi:RHH-type rel operon transcriptional repressor/antitoxin RelB
MISIELPAELESRLDELARETGRTVDYYVIEAVVEHLDDIEDLRIAEKRWGDICAGKSKPVPLEEIMWKYGVED